MPVFLPPFKKECINHQTTIEMSRLKYTVDVWFWCVNILETHAQSELKMMWQIMFKSIEIKKMIYREVSVHRCLCCICMQ